MSAVTISNSQLGYFVQYPLRSRVGSSSMPRHHRRLDVRDCTIWLTDSNTGGCAVECNVRDALYTPGVEAGASGRVRAATAAVNAQTAPR